MACGMWDDWLTWDRRYGVDAFGRSEESLRHWCVIWDFAWLGLAGLDQQVSLAILARHYHCLERFLRKLKKDVIFTLGSVSFLWSIDEDDGWWMDGWMELSWRVLRRLHSARTGA